MNRIKVDWSTVWRHLDVGRELNVYDANGTAWRRNAFGSAWREALFRSGPDGIETWTPEDDEPVWIDPPLPEPPDGTRIEFEHHTDVYAAWRDDDSSARAGYPVGDGGEVWCLHGQTVPRSWAVMWLEFGDSLRTAVRLVPHPDDVGNYDRWPTSVMAASEGKS